MNKKKRYYQINERVYIKPERVFGTIKGLNINPKDNTYKATIEVTLQDGDATHISTREYDLWEIDKDKSKSSRGYKRQEPIEVKIKYFDKSVPEISKIENGDWIDLRVREGKELSAGEFALIPLNVAMELPNGYEAYVVPRSSTFKNWGILQTNSQGIIDNSYCGDDDEWLYPVYATRDTVIKKGDRICQFRIQQKMPILKFQTVEKLENENRSGFGSTGTN